MRADQPFGAQARVIEPLLIAGTTIAAPPRCTRKDQSNCDRHLYEARQVVENFFAELKPCRRIAHPDMTKPLGLFAAFFICQALSFGSMDDRPWFAVDRTHGNAAASHIQCCRACLRCRQEIRTLVHLCEARGLFLLHQQSLLTMSTQAPGTDLGSGSAAPRACRGRLTSRVAAGLLRVVSCVSLLPEVSRLGSLGCMRSAQDDDPRSRTGDLKKRRGGGTALTRALHKKPA
jgi:hypothetical protein